MKKFSIALLVVGVFLSITGVVSAQSVATGTVTFQIKNQLKAGAKGEEVKALQTILASQPGIYPEGTINGLYGPATTRAVKRFQKKYGLSQVGTVGPKTLIRLNKLDVKKEISVSLPSGIRTAPTTNVPIAFPTTTRPQGTLYNMNASSTIDATRDFQCPGNLVKNTLSNRPPCIPVLRNRPATSTPR